MKIISVLPITKYAPEDELSYYSKLNLFQGDIVKIPFGRKIILGIVRETKDAKEEKFYARSRNFKMKKIIERVNKSFLHKNIFESINEISQYSFVKPGKIAEILIPRSIREENFIINKTKKDIILPSNSALYGSLYSRAKFLRPIIREFLGNGKSIFVVVPTIFDIKIFSENLGKNIENIVINLSHKESRKKISKKLTDFFLNKKGYLIIGTPSYLSIVMEKISLVIIENENSNFYSKELLGFEIKKFIQLLSQKFKVPIFYSDRYLSTEVWKEIKSGNLKKIETKYENEAEITLIAKKNESEKNSINKETLNIISKRLEKNEKGFILSTRKGYAPSTFCRDCGHIISCLHCNRPLVIYKINSQKNIFRCNNCKIETDTEILCPKCKSWQLYSFGSGTQKIAEEISLIIKKTKIKILDGENEKISEKKRKIEEFKKINSAILISTLKYSYIRSLKTDFSFIPYFYSFSSLPTYKISEKILDSISILKEISKNILIENYEEMFFLIKDIIENKIEELQMKELSLREKLNLPPYSTLIKIKIKANTIEDLFKETEKVLKDFIYYEPEKNETIYKNKKIFIQNIIIRIPTEFWEIKDGILQKEDNLTKKLLSLNHEIEINSDSLF